MSPEERTLAAGATRSSREQVEYSSKNLAESQVLKYSGYQSVARRVATWVWGAPEKTLGGGRDSVMRRSDAEQNFQGPA